MYSVSVRTDLNPVAVKLPDPAVDLVRNPLGWGRLERLFHRTSALRQLREVIIEVHDNAAKGLSK